MRTINLSAGLSLYDVRSAFPIGDLDLYIKDLPKMSGEFRLVAFVNRSKIGEYTLSREHNIITIPRSSLSAGNFSCYVSHYVGDTEVHRYIVEDLVISDLNTDISATPEIAELKEQISELTGKLSDLSAKASELENKLKENDDIFKRVDDKLMIRDGQTACYYAKLCALMKWAYGVENAVPYLTGGSVDDFEKKLDIPLTDNEKNYIGGTSNDKT